jgi:hypothetical protein
LVLEMVWGPSGMAWGLEWGMGLGLVLVMGLGWVLVRVWVRALEKEWGLELAQLGSALATASGQSAPEWGLGWGLVLGLGWGSELGSTSVGALGPLEAEWGTGSVRLARALAMVWVR